MPRLFLLSIVTLGMLLAGTGAHAQGAVSQTQNPPSPNAQNSQMGMSPNSLPPGGQTGAVGAPGGAINTQATSGMNTLHPMHPPRHRTARRRVRRHVAQPAASSFNASPQAATNPVG